MLDVSMYYLVKLHDDGKVDKYKFSVGHVYVRVQELQSDRWFDMFGWQGLDKVRARQLWKTLLNKGYVRR
jgi:hypothetical protein